MLEALGGFESGDFSIKPKFRSTITPKLFTQLFEFEFRDQNFLEQKKCFHVGRVSGWMAPRGVDGFGRD